MLMGFTFKERMDVILNSFNSI